MMRERIRADAAACKSKPFDPAVFRTMTTENRIERARTEELPPYPLMPSGMSQHWVYIFQAKEMIKVGITANVDARLKSINHVTPFDVSYYDSKRLPRYLAQWTEGKIMAALSEFHVKGEWFACAPELAHRKFLIWHGYAMTHDRELRRLARRK